MPSLVVVVLLTVAFAVAGCGSDPTRPAGTGCPDQSARAVSLASLALGSGRDIEVQDGVAYVAAWMDGLQIVDVSDPVRPQWMGQVDVADDVTVAALGISVANGRAYLAVGENGLAIVDVSDPARPVSLLESSPQVGDARDVTVSGDLALVTTPSTLVAVDVADAQTPEILDSLSLERESIGGHVAVRGTTAYVTDRFDRILVVSLEDPRALSVTSTLPFPQLPRHIAVQGDFGYVTDAAYGLHVLDLADPSQPAVVAQLATPGRAQGLSVAGSRVYVADRIGGVQVVDVTEPTAPRIQGWLKAEGEPESVVAVGNRLFVANLQAGLQVLDIRRMLPTYGAATPANANGFVVEGDRMYVPALGDGLHVVDVTDPTHPVLLADVKTKTTSVAVAGELVVAGDLEGFFVYDFREAPAPRVVGSLLAGPGSDVFFPAGLDYREPYVFVADLALGLVVIDLTVPSDPRVVATLPSPGLSRRLALGDSILYLADGEAGVGLVDVSDPALPTWRGTIATTDARDVLLDGTTLYVADGEAGLSVFDVSDPQAPLLLATVDTPGTAVGVRLDGVVAHVADAAKGVQLVRVRPVRFARLRGSVATPGDARLAAVVEDRLFVADSRVGVMSVDVPCP